MTDCAPHNTTGAAAWDTGRGAAAAAPEPTRAQLAADLRLENFAGALALWKEAGQALRWPCLFTLPPWLRAWWRVFGVGKPQLLAFGAAPRTVGLVPLMLAGAGACFMGDVRLCDHLDVALAPGSAPVVAEGLWRHLRQQEVSWIEAACLRPDSLLATELIPALSGMGCAVTLDPAGVSLELALPASWEGYLESLDGRQRHELRRKLRHLDRAGAWRFRLLEGPQETGVAMERFIALFCAQRSDKAAFMDGRMQRYFRHLAAELAEHGLLRLGCLEIQGAVAAMTLAVEHQGRLHLYNNAYDERFGMLSVGQLSKVFTLRVAIERGLAVFDFLKGAEPYKHRLGGRPVTLQRCRIELAGACGRQPAALRRSPADPRR
jgi:CelD/BcsL family acetyltransferase involved in cellulose biosynthesis